MDSTPAWMLCQDMLLRAKEAFIEEAIETLDKEIEAKRVDVKGNLVTSEEESGSLEKKLFIINNIAASEQEIIDRHTSAIRELERNPGQLTSQTIERIESLKKFLLAVAKISALTEYGAVFEEWADDVGHHTKEASAEKVLKSTISKDSRVGASEFLLKNKKISAIFSEGELDSIRKALSASGQPL